MIESLLTYAKSLNARQEVIDYINTTIKKQFSSQRSAVIREVTGPEEVEHVIDYLVSKAAPSRLRKMSYADAKRKADEWSKQSQKKGRNLSDTDKDIETIHDFLDGTRIVRLKTKEALRREGFLMSHCVGNYDETSSDCHIYSYRDKKNVPHATFEVRKNNQEIVQIKGKGNGSIHPKYINPILTFLQAIGLNIRPNDMKNLGYYHVNKSILDTIRDLPGADKQLVVLSGETYAF